MHNPPIILLADDEADFREIITKKFSSAGFEIHAVPSGAEAVKQAAALKPDLILMDVRMPGELNGIDAAFRIKENQETKDIKIAFLSGVDNPWPAIVGERTEVSKEFGMEDFIPKTDDLDTLVETAKGFLGLREKPSSR